MTSKMRIRSENCPDVPSPSRRTPDAFDSPDCSGTADSSKAGLMVLGDSVLSVHAGLSGGVHPARPVTAGSRAIVTKFRLRGCSVLEESPHAGHGHTQTRFRIARGASVEWPAPASGRHPARWRMQASPASPGESCTVQDPGPGTADSRRSIGILHGAGPCSGQMIRGRSVASCTVQYAADMMSPAPCRRRVGAG